MAKLPEIPVDTVETPEIHSDTTREASVAAGKLLAEIAGALPPAGPTGASGEPPAHLTSGDDALLQEIDRLRSRSPGLMMPVADTDRKMRSLDDILDEVDAEMAAANAIEASMLAALTSPGR